MNTTELIELQKQGYLFSESTSTALVGSAATQPGGGTDPYTSSQLLTKYETSPVPTDEGFKCKCPAPWLPPTCSSKLD